MSFRAMLELLSTAAAALWGGVAAPTVPTSYDRALCLPSRQSPPQQYSYRERRPRPRSSFNNKSMKSPNELTRVLESLIGSFKRSRFPFFKSINHGCIW